MSACGKQEKFSFPGLAKSIVRPVVKTRSVVKRGEKVVGNVSNLAVSTVRNTVSATGKVTTGVVDDVAGLATHTVKNTISGTSKIASGVMRGSVKIAKDAVGIKTPRKSSGKKSSKK